jgi:hypothetical protein
MVRVAPLLALAAVLCAAPARADEPAGPAAPKTAPKGPAAPADAAVGVVTGDGVNLRVGPRLDDVPVTMLEQGTTVVIVERAGEWFGVRVPAGFQAAVAGALTEVVDDDHVRIARTEVNLRLKPPSGDVAYAAFRDRPERGTVLPVIVREGDWVWVEAPEEIRAYVHSKYVRELGPLADHEAEVAKARAIRVARETARQEAKKKAGASKDDEALRAEIGAVGAALAKVRAAGGYDRLPVVQLSDRLSSVSEAHPNASARVKALAKALQDDLEREIELRVAWTDEELARARTGRPAGTASPPPAPKVEAVAIVGVLEWEAAKGADGGGAFVLWDAAKPAHLVRWPGGDLSKWNGQNVRIHGRSTGARVQGLPLLEVDRIEPAGK